MTWASAGVQYVCYAMVAERLRIYTANRASLFYYNYTKQRRGG